MPADPKQYRENVSRCAELAERASDAQLREVLKMRTRRWVQMAAKLECVPTLKAEQNPSDRKPRT
jgi:hypothetical protein